MHPKQQKGQGGKHNRSGKRRGNHGETNTDLKRLHGQFFTTTNPFSNRLFCQWARLIPDFSSQTLLEPFAGACNIVAMMRELGHRHEWACFDIDPPTPAPDPHAPPVSRQDTLANFPQGFTVIATNPPYLARNSASRRGLPFPQTEHDDLYKHALAVMLNNCPYVAAVIPESFLTCGLFHARLYGVVSLTCRMFEDTEIPVCLALFTPTKQARGKDFWLYQENVKLGTYAKLRAAIEPFQGKGLPWRFNDPHGNIALFALDNHREASIRFAPGADIDHHLVSSASRSNTRISCEGLQLSLAQRDALIAQANRILSERRALTHDTLMTPFMGLRDDGKFRRRLDYKQAREILNLAASFNGLIPGEPAATPDEAGSAADSVSPEPASPSAPQAPFNELLCAAEAA